MTAESTQKAGAGASGQNQTTGASAREKIEDFLRQVELRNPNEPEFNDAVREFVETVYPYIETNPEFKAEAILERMVEPDRMVTFRVCWEDDQGQVHVNRGYRVQFNNTLGPYKGGLRFHPTVNASVLKFLAFEQVFKNALTLLPLGGGKGGADFDPKGRSDREVMRFCQAFMTELARHIGSDRDVPAGDIGVGEREIGYLYGQYKRLQDESRGVLTGKGVGYGGSLMRSEATGYGTVFFAEEMLIRKGDTLEGKTCVISGSGNVALFATEKLLSKGAKVVTLSESDGYIYEPEGFTTEKLAYLKELKFVRRGRLTEYAEHFGCEYRANKRPWEVACDLAFPCATQGELDKASAETLVANGCIGVIEGANMPSDLDAVSYFLEKRILFGPAKAANAGGVAVSGLEMTQNSMRQYWTHEKTEEKLRVIMHGIHKQCVAEGDEGDWVDYVKGSNLAAFKRVGRAMMNLGLH